MVDGSESQSDVGQLRRLRLAWAGLLAAVAIIGIIDMPSMFYAGDPVIWRFEARKILQGRLAIDPQYVPPTAEPGQLAVQNPRNGLWYSKYGLMNSIMLLPATAADRITGGLTEPLTEPQLIYYNLWNVLLAVALAGAFMKLSGRYTRRLAARLIFVGATLYGTFLWYYLRAQGSEIYQTLFFTLAFLFLVGFSDDYIRTRRLHLAWVFIAALCFTRVLYVLLIPMAAGFVAITIARMPRESWREAIRRLLPHLLVPPILIAIGLGWINFVKFGSPFLTGYHVWHPEEHLPGGNWLDGLKGFFILPRFNMFLYFPTILIGLLGIRRFAKQYPLDGLAALGGLVVILLIAKIPTWSGEWTYGPRYILFALPVLSLPFLLLLDRWMVSWRSAGSILLSIAAVSVLIYSSYIQIRVNQLDFHAYYQFRLPLQNNWSPAIEDRFMNHHVGLVLDDIVRHCDDPMAMPWFVEFTRLYSPESVDKYYGHLRSYIRRGNHYWWSGP